MITHPEKVPVPGGRDHQGRAGLILRSDRAAHVAAYLRPPDHNGAVIIAASARRASSRRMSRRDSPIGWSASRFRRRVGRCIIRWPATPNRCCGSPTRTASRRMSGSRASRIWITPTSAVFDLDPSEDRPDDLRDAALLLRDVLLELGLKSWVKTSGSKGFHIVVPLDRKDGYGEVAGFAHRVGSLMVRRDPDRLTQEFSKADRGTRIWWTRDATATAQRSRPPTRFALSPTRPYRRRVHGMKSRAGSPRPRHLRCERWPNGSPGWASYGKGC